MAKIFYIYLFIFISSLLYSRNDYKYIDTVNIRKAFFLNENDWQKYSGKINKTTDRDNNIGFILKYHKKKYEIVFYPVVNEDWENIYTCGMISYQFNNKKELLKVKVFYQKNNNSYLYFDRNKKNKFDIYLFGKIYKKSIIYHLSFDSLKIMSLATIFKMLREKKLDKEILIEKNDREIKEKFINKIIGPALEYEFNDDGARDKFGRFVYLNDNKDQLPDKAGLNCSGFVKEIADSYIRLYNQNHKYLDIDELKKRRLTDRVNISIKDFEYEYDPFFGLDWGKNIMDKINLDCNFNIIQSYELKDDEYSIYQNFRGYDVIDLKNILFRDQQSDSTFFYIIIFNKLRHKTPIIQRFYHLSIIVPFYNNHHFYLNVYESAEKTSFSNILKYHKDAHAIIIKVPLPISKL